MRQIITLSLSLLATMATAQTFPVLTLKNAGPVDRRVNIAVLPDGFTAAELPVFDLSADTMARNVFLQTPLKEYANFFNVYAIDVPSVESGTDHPANATDVTEPIIPFSDVNTYFSASFDGGSTHRALVCNDEPAAYAVMAANFPSYDQIILLANSFEYGGTGGPVATFSRNSSSIETALHELGHSFAHLADEYWAGWGSELANMTAETDTAVIRWHNWLHTGSIGHYPYGTSGDAAGWFRPHQNCKMQFLNRPFCQVCREAFIDRIYSLVTPIDSAWPDNSSTLTYSGTPLTFTIKLVKPNPNTLKVKWRANGVDLPSTDTTITINTSMLDFGLNDLTAFVTDTTTLSRSYRPNKGYEFTASWGINCTVSVIDVSAPRTGDHFFYSMYPVPARDRLHIDCDNGTNDKEMTYTLTDVAGRAVRTGKLPLVNGKQSLAIELAGVTPGAYIVTLRSKGIDVVEKVVVE